MVTDHIRNLKLSRTRPQTVHRRLRARPPPKVGIPVTPGGEMEMHWNSAATTDFSEAHTLALSIRPLVAFLQLDWTTPETDPFAPWLDSQGATGTILALQEKLRRYNLPPQASHQFQHSLLSTKRGEHSDYRYDLDRLPTSRYLDFFYSGTDELIHEMEDILLVARYATTDPEAMKAVYSSCDSHMGPQTTWPPIAHLLDRIKPLNAAYRWLFKTLAAGYFRLKGDAEAAPFPWFADEQLSHATYVYLGEQPCNEETVLEAIRDGRTCVTRGAAEFANLEPAPSFSRPYPTPVHLHLHLPVSYSEPRPRSVIVYRNGAVIHWEPYAIAERSIQFTYIDRSPPPGQHVYQVYVPSKFLSSPLLFG